MSEVVTESKVRAIGSDSSFVRHAFAQFPSGVAVLAVDIDGSKHALVVSSFMVGVSLDPCLVAVAVQNTSETWPLISGAPAVGVSILGKGQSELTRKLASKDRAARFEDVAVDVGSSGAVLLDDAGLWLECSFHQITEAGDHWMVLLEVSKLGVGDNEPLIWHGAKFRELVDSRSLDVE
ncbi:flavin reductase family protein [Rhodococcus opacus]|uniref:flavin reductase family protein n=1 Tax=Rhodococcus opacus TaxID=37919 RepID=UPI0024742EE9|nr:flavin reductase family protein [Rhodococcus opacus]MDH6291325.1 flavin reductase (DIM6/NTAB) family NADH-FMN oxidoreductase RutF [Rhodococcus opacus]